METFTAAPHHDILLVLFRVAVLLFAARALGEIAQRLGQPSVIGEILAGILLGPSVLGALFPVLDAWIVPEPGLQGYLLELVSLCGALFLLLITGLETDLALIRRHARTAIGVSLGGVTVTLLSGFALGMALPDFMLANPEERLVFAMFVATAMSISAIPVIAKVLMDLNLMRRDIGQTIIASGMSDDTIGWILLSIVAGLAGTGEVTAETVVESIGRVVLFMGVSFTLGRYLLKRMLDFVQDEVRSPDRLVTLVVVMMFAWGAFSQGIGLEAVLGAFVMGVLFGQMPRLPKDVHQKLTTVALAIFSPVFFATAGLKVNAANLLELTLLALTLLVIFVATVGKVAGTYAGARLIGRRDHWTSLSFGAGLNARGAMEIIIATIGLELGILSQDMFSIIVIMAMATSLMAPPALRWVLARVQPEAQELERLKREELAAASVIANVHRVLIPVRIRPRADPIHEIEAFIVRALTRKGPLAATLLTVPEDGTRQSGTEYLDRMHGYFQATEVTRKVVPSADPEREILNEAAKDYDLLILGATQRRIDDRSLFHPLVDRMVRMAPCPTVVVKGAVGASGWPPRRVLVPTNGSLAARRAAELAFALMPEEIGEVLVLNVIQTQEERFEAGDFRYPPERERTTARSVVAELAEMGRANGARVVTRVEESSAPEDVILDLARSGEVDLILLGTDVRPGSSRLFLGPRVERVLASAPCPVLVLNAS